MNCLILGDKYQNGMKSKGCPALIAINNKTKIFDHQYSILESIVDNLNIYYVYGFDSKKFIEFYKNSSIEFTKIYNEQYNQYNQAFSLSLAQKILDRDDTLIIDGYQRLNKALIKKLINNTHSTIIVNKNSNHDSESVGCIINQDSVVSLSLDLNNQVQNIYYLNKQCSFNLSRLLDNKKYHNNFIFELLNKLIDQGNIIKPILV